MLLRSFAVLAFTVTACGDNLSPYDSSSEPAHCIGENEIELGVSVPTYGQIRSELVIHGGLRVPPTVTVLGVYVAVQDASAAGMTASPPLPTIAADKTSIGYTTWKATIPLSVLLSPLAIVPGLVRIVAVPQLNCNVGSDTFGTSEPFTVNTPLDAGVGAGVNAATSGSSGTSM